MNFSAVLFGMAKLFFVLKMNFIMVEKQRVDEAMGLICNSTIVNLVGKACVEKAISKGYVHPDAVIKIEGVPHAQIMKI